MKFIKLTNRIVFTKSPPILRQRLTFQKGYWWDACQWPYSQCEHLVENAHWPVGIWGGGVAVGTRK